MKFFYIIGIILDFISIFIIGKYSDHQFSKKYGGQFYITELNTRPLGPIAINLFALNYGYNFETNYFKYDTSQSSESPCKQQEKINVHNIFCICKYLLPYPHNKTCLTCIVKSKFNIISGLTYPLFNCKFLSKHRKTLPSLILRFTLSMDFIVNALSMRCLQSAFAMREYCEEDM